MNAKINNTRNDIIDLDLSVTAKKAIRFDKDDNRIVYINTSDMGIIKRFEDAIEKLNTLQKESLSVLSNEIESATEEESAHLIAETLEDIDAKMRTLIDEIFDAPVSAVAAPSGTMYDPFNGTWRYEYIIECIILHCTENLVEEFKKMDQKLKKHTQKYTKGKKK